MWIEQLNSPLIRERADGTVSQTVLDDEMSLFLNAQRVLK